MLVRYDVLVMKNDGTCTQQSRYGKYLNDYTMRDEGNRKGTQIRKEEGSKLEQGIAFAI